MKKRIRAVSIMWGLAGGGISHYVGSLEELNNKDYIELFHVLIKEPDWKTHQGLKDKIKPNVILIKHRLDFRWILKLKKLIKYHNPDILLIHGFNGFIVAGICRLFRVKLPLLATYHGDYFPTSIFRKVISRAINTYSYEFLKHLANKVITVSEIERQHIIGHGIRPDKVTIVHNGIPDSEISKHNAHTFLKEKKFPQNSFIIGTTSSFQPIKGIKYLLRAMPQIIGHYPNTYLLLFGRGPLKSKLEELCSNLKITKNVHFMGFSTEVNLWLSCFDVFVLPSLYEAHSISLLEAMRASCPIVCTNVGGNPETIRNGFDGFVIPSKNTVALKDSIIKLNEDPGLRKTLGKSARTRFEECFTEDVMLDKTLKVIEDVL